MLHMNRFLLVSALAVAAAGCKVAYADEIGDFVSTKSRAEVRAEFVAFKASGVNPWSGAYNMHATITQTRSPADVQAEFLAAREEMHAFLGEDSGSAWLAASSQPGRTQAGTQFASLAK
jgi:hypothetical protein